MASTSLHLLSAIFLLTLLFSKGTCKSRECFTIDLIIRQETTGDLVQGKPEYKMKILNACPCLQGNVKLECKGFQTVEEIDPLVLRKTDNNECLYRNGSTIIPFSEPYFFYAWDTQFPFKALSSEINCD